MGGAALAATPALLAALDKLPPADDQPQVDEAEAAQVTPGQFQVRRFVRPWTKWLGFGLGLVMADALLSLLGPFFVRQGLDQGVAHADLGRLWLTTTFFFLSVVADWVVTWGYTWITGRTSERMLFALRIKIFSHLQSLSLDYYDTELDGRVMTRMTTDVDALSQLVQTGLINAVVGAITCVGRVRVPGRAVAHPGPGRGLGAAPAGPGHLVVPQALDGGLRRGPRVHRRCERQPAGEPVGRAGGPGLRA